MAFQFPAFPITCNIWSSGSNPITQPPRVAAAACNLAWGQRVSGMSTGGTTLAGVIVCTMTLLLESGTDIRGRAHNGGEDIVEVPSGSQRFFFRVFAHFIGKGFTNQHKGEVLVQIDPFKTPDT